MVRTIVVVVGEDRDQCEKVKTLSQGMGCAVQQYTPDEWARVLNDQGSRTQLMGDRPQTQMLSEETGGAKILQFPQAKTDDQKLRTINELESLAIENAINEFGGNLTEAAKALGIGRATLYRKVKQYNIDPANARRKRAA